LKQEFDFRKTPLRMEFDSKKLAFAYDI